MRLPIDVEPDVINTVALTASKPNSDAQGEADDAIPVNQNASN